MKSYIVLILVMIVKHYMEVSKEILNHQNIATIHSGLLMTLTYDSEIYQVLNGDKDWSLHSYRN